MTKLIIYSFLSLLAAGGFWSVKDRFVAGETSKDLYLSLLHPIKTFDPSQAFNDDSLTVLGQSLETLYQYHYLKRPYEVIPSLADGKPKISKEGTVYEIKIKQRVAYHDQTEFFKKRRYVKAQDFINQFKRLAFKPLKSTGTWLFSGKIKGFDEFSERVGNDFDKMMSSSIEGLKAVDDHTLRIELTRPEPNMLYFL
ncbi:MAG: ABC transporter substrate-binding protein, partial [Bacteriovoracaceae bacterium]